MENGQEYCVKWPKRDKTVKTRCYDFFLSKEYADVTLCAEGKYIACHQLILASCSAHFDSIFKSKVGGDRPIIIFNDMKLCDLLAVLQYCYTGEVQIPHSQLNSFVQTVISLQMKGVLESDEQPENVATAEPEVDEDPPMDTAVSPLDIDVETFESPPLFYELTVPSFSTAREEFSADLEEIFLIPTEDESSGPSPQSPNQPSTSDQGNSRGKRQLKCPSHFSSFQLDVKEAIVKPPNVSSRACKFCLKIIRGPPVGILDKRRKHEQKCKNNPNQLQTLAKCPICQKAMRDKYVKQHLQRIHGNNLKDS